MFHPSTIHSGPNIISVSRRTDVPAFYGQWFMNRVEEGFAGYTNPFSGKTHFVSLKPEDVICFVFWSKNFTPFIEHLKIIEARGYKFYFNYTINGYPAALEDRVAPQEKTIDTLKRMSDRYSPLHINWRYDPLVISDITDWDFHLEHFASLAASIQGYAERCYFSFVTLYGKVKKRFESLRKDKHLSIVEPDPGSKIRFSQKLAEIASQYGITMYTCCGDALLSSRIQKAHCIDGNLINRLFYTTSLGLRKKPTRKECGCTGSYDIGAYDTCPHGCVYCYANMDREISDRALKNHDEKSALLLKPT
ncbi:DUF1848 domain-containing protein [Fibrobacterota bacterium]